MLARAGFANPRTSRAHKPVSFDYAREQFREYNPLIHSLLSLIGKAIPARLTALVIPVPVGEMALIAERAADGPPAQGLGTKRQAV
jgi:hypothetical protein